MANRTEKTAKTVKGTNPQFLVEKIIRQRIYDSMYWKEHCFALTAELVVDKGMDLRYIGGIYAGNIKPTPFLCLALKMLQIQPDKDIVLEFIQQEEFKYIRALGAMYLRLTFDSTEIYKYLEPLYNDFRKLRYMNKMGRFEAIYMDEFIDNLLREDRYCDIQLPRLQKRWALEEVETLAPYKSLLDGDLVAMSDSEDEEEEETKKEKPRLTSRRRSRSRDRERDVGDRREVREREKMRERRERGDNEPGPSSSSSARRDDRDDRRRDRDRSRDRKDRKDDERRDRKKDSSRRGADNDEEREIAEANALRAKLGMAPLER